MPTIVKRMGIVTLLLVLTIGLGIMSYVNYLLFHSIVEIFSICIAMTVFAITINSHHYLKSNFMIIVGLGYGFIAVFDFLHTIGYKGMGIFTDYDYYANQLWIVARFTESLVILFGLYSLKFKRKVNSYTILIAFSLISGFLLFVIFGTHYFPAAFIEGQGQTTFKIICEYMIVLILFLCIRQIGVYRYYFEKNVVKWMQISLYLTIISELLFTLYTDNYGITNILGHYFKVFSFYFIYKTIIQKSIREPYNLIFKELNETRHQLAEQNEKLLQEVNYDSLTHLHNHGYCFNRIEEEIKRYERYRVPFVLIMMDVDFFKTINDTYGHLMGDKVLRMVAITLQENVRKSDLVGRYGGDEFIIMLVETEREEGKIVAETIRKKIQDLTFEEDIQITVSMGICEYHDGNVDTIINEADESLYHAKLSGRNRVRH